MGYIGWSMLRSGQMLSKRLYGGCGLGDLGPSVELLY